MTTYNATEIVIDTHDEDQQPTCGEIYLSDAEFKELERSSLDALITDMEEQEERRQIIEQRRQGIRRARAHDWR